MLARIGVIAFNTYRESVRARVLHGLFALALATGAYSLVVGAYSLQQGLRAVSDLGSASISIYGIVVAIVLGATSLHRELELKTVFPILARPISRAEYLLGKYLGTVLTVSIFVAGNAGALLLALSHLAGRPVWQPLAFGACTIGLTLLVAWRWPWTRTAAAIPLALVCAVGGWWLAAGAPDDRRVVALLALLTVCEVAIVAAIANVFASFSSPFLTAVFTFGLFIVGRSADTLAHMPARVFGEGIKAMAEILSRLVPNLMLYVPPRPLLTGEAAGVALGPYIGLALAHAAAWSIGLLAAASLIFRRRDFL